MAKEKKTKKPSKTKKATRGGLKQGSRGSKGNKKNETTTTKQAARSSRSRYNYGNKRIPTPPTANVLKSYVTATKALIDHVTSTPNTDRTVVFQKLKGMKAFVLPKGTQADKNNILETSEFAVDFTTGKVLKKTHTEMTYNHD